MTNILLIRHGLTDAVGRWIAGRGPGTHLNDEGRRQVTALAAHLVSTPLAAVISSPLARALETAEPIARPHGLTVERTEAFTEFDFGEWEGRRFDELNDDPMWRRFNAFRSGTRTPGGESMLDVQQRAVAALLHLRDRAPGRTIAIVSHGDVIRAIVMYLLGIPLDFVHRVEISPASVTTIDISHDEVSVGQVNGDTVRRPLE